MKMLFLMALFLQRPPSIDDWEIVTKFNYEIRNYAQAEKETVTASSYMGVLSVYKNPANPEELAVLVLKYPPITIVPKSAKSGKPKSQINSNVIDNYNQKTRREEFEKRFKASDLVIFIKWEETKDPRTGEQILTGSIENWILNQNGKWIFKISHEPLMKIELLSEPKIGDISNTVFVGFKFSINGDYHILKIDQKDLEAKEEGAK